VIRPDELKIVRGEGMPKYREPSGKGNLIIRFEVEFPTLLDPLIVDALVAILPPKTGACPRSGMWLSGHQKACTYSHLKLPYIIGVCIHFVNHPVFHLATKKLVHTLILNHFNRDVYSSCDGFLFTQYSVTEEDCKITLYCT